MTQPTPHQGRPRPAAPEPAAPEPAAPGPAVSKPPVSDPAAPDPAAPDPATIEPPTIEPAATIPPVSGPAAPEPSAPSQVPSQVPSPEQPGGVRASDAEREAAVERLRIASVEGRLTFGELTERTEAAYSAVTRGELETITSDLPGLGAPGADPAPRQERRKFTAVMGDVKERIVGRIDQELEALSVMGDVRLDLRDSQVPAGEVTIIATAVMGDVKIIVPDGVDVRMTGFAIMGDRRVQVSDMPSGPSVPIVRVRAQAIMGDVIIQDEEHHAPLRNALKTWWESRNDDGPPPTSR